MKLLDLSTVTVAQLFARFRGVCIKYFEDHPIKLGGPGGKRKYHRGRASYKSLWVFDLVDTSSFPGIGYMEIVNARNCDTLLPIIQKVVLQGTTIHSDQWKAYAKIEQTLGLSHATVNHSVNFVDPVTGAHTQAIESYWNKHKIRIKSMLGCNRVLKFIPARIHVDGKKQTQCFSKFLCMYFPSIFN